MLVRRMEMALWSTIICLPFLIMNLSLCPIDCGYWMLSLNQFFSEEKWFVYEQTFPLLSMTALEAAWKWMKPQTTGVHGAENVFSACSNYSIWHTCLFLKRSACPMHVDCEAQYRLTVTYSSPFQGRKSFLKHWILHDKIHGEVFYIGEKEKFWKASAMWSYKDMWNSDGQHSFYKAKNFLLPFQGGLNGPCSMIKML